jgi:predicted metal-dependent hydrolase
MTLVEPPAADPNWPRYGSAPFPPYRFIPGLNPHPRRHPRGHAYGTPETPPPSVPPELWRENRVYLEGIDLYNYSYWWECHEVLEGLWHLTGHRGTEAQFLQGIIQVAAANLKRHVGSRTGSRRLGQEAVDRLSSVGRPRYMGLMLDPFIREVREYHLEECTPRIPLIRLGD